MTDKEPKESIASVTARVSRRWSSMLRFWCLMAGLGLILCGVLLLITLTIRPLLTSASVTITPSGAYIIETRGKRTAQWLFCASSMWESSGIKVNKGDNVEFRVSGKANLAIHHLVNSAHTDSTPYFHWVGPDGDDDTLQGKYYRDVDRHRQQKRISTGVAPGMLLMQVVPSDRSVATNPDPEYLYPIGSGKDSPFKMRQSGTLYFAINDIPLNKNMKNWYVIPESVDAEYSKQHKNQEQSWNRIKQEEYWNLWFDDNVGYFLILAKIR